GAGHPAAALAGHAIDLAVVTGGAGVAHHLLLRRARPPLDPRRLGRHLLHLAPAPARRAGDVPPPLAGAPADPTEAVAGSTRLHALRLRHLQRLGALLEIRGPADGNVPQVGRPADVIDVAAGERPGRLAD